MGVVGDARTPAPAWQSAGCCAMGAPLGRPSREVVPGSRPGKSSREVVPGSRQRPIGAAEGGGPGRMPHALYLPSATAASTAPRTCPHAARAGGSGGAEALPASCVLISTPPGATGAAGPARRRASRVRPELPGAGARVSGRGQSEPGDHAIDRSCGGASTKLDLGCERHGRPLAVVLTGGNVNGLHCVRAGDDGCVAAGPRPGRSGCWLTGSLQPRDPCLPATAPRPDRWAATSLRPGHPPPPQRRRAPLRDHRQNRS
jgi:hypothetical protein